MRTLSLTRPGNAALQRLSSNGPPVFMPSFSQTAVAPEYLY